MSIFKSFQTRNAYTVEELYSYLANYTFCAGAPSLQANITGYNIIVFHVDEYNSIWITPDNYGTRTQNWVITKQEQDPGIDNFVKHTVIDGLTAGWASTVAFLGKSTRDSYYYVDELVRQITSLGL